MLAGVRRIYDKRELTDGKRILVDRLWPRGVKKSTQNLDDWFKDVAPSDDLRKWFDHDPGKWEEFKKKYREELVGNRKFEELVKLAGESDVTLVYASKDTEHNNAVALAEFVRERLAS
ncbi:MAG: DUF488 domain-containing protein [Candidatus Marsarchaeota archaeon]|nr:DUF488 domain-containing protein [Candidatus Marsarchaeota archaeon]